MKLGEQILVVDDMENNRVFLRELFCEEYTVLEAENGVQALKILRKNSETIRAILLDIVMPVMDGFQFMSRLQKNGTMEKIPIILIAAADNQENEIKALELGAVDMIIKPFHPQIVKKRVEHMIELYQRKNHLEQMQTLQTQKMKENNGVMIDALSAVIEYRNLESGLHVRRIRVFTKALLDCVAQVHPELELTEGQIETICGAAALHDIGKIAIPDAILLKPAGLTPSEFEIMKTHTTKGCEILSGFQRIDDKDYLRYSFQICRSHHERWDGSGYPDGLRGNEIPLGAQVVAIADVYDSLTNDRVYRAALSHEKAMEMIFAGECGAFSSDLLDCFYQVGETFRELGAKHADTHGGDLSIPDDKIGETLPARTFAEELHEASESLVKETIERDTLVNTIPGGVAKFAINKEFEVLLASDGFYRLTGYTREEYHNPPISGKGIRLLLDADAARVAKEIAGQIALGQPICVEYRIRKKDGCIAWINVNGTQVEKEGELAVVQAVFIDITASKQNERELLELINSVPGGVVRISYAKEVQLIFSSAGFYQIFGYTEQEFHSRFPEGNLLELLDPSDRDLLIEQLKKCPERGNFSQECRAHSKDGTEKWILISGVRSEDERGNSCLQCVVSDITVSRAIENTLKMNEERYRIIIEQAQDVVFEWDMQSDHFYHSPAFEKKFGYQMPQDDFFGFALTGDAIYGADKPAFMEFRRRLESGQTYVTAEYRVCTHTGIYLWCSAKATVIFGEEHQPVRAIGILSDINEYKRENAVLEARAQKDLLTGLYNKMTTQAMIEDCLLGEGKSEYHALYVVDIDNFKKINDTFGHLQGDRVLGVISARIREQFRDGDILGRAGGDEFVIFLRNIPSVEVAVKKAKVLSSIFQRRTLPEMIDFEASGSVGAAIYPRDGKTFQELFLHADEALYLSKNRGKGCYTFFAQDTQDEKLQS